MSDNTTINFTLKNQDVNTNLKNDGLAGQRTVNKNRNVHKSNDGLSGFRVVDNYKGDDHVDA